MMIDIDATNSDNLTLGEFLRYHRIRNGLTLREVSSYININYSTLAKIETGKISTLKSKYIYRLADILEIHYWDLYWRAYNE